MALHSELPVYRDTYQMLLRIYALTQDFGREFKYTLGQDMKRDSLQLVRCIYRANRSADKKEHLMQFQEEFELLKLEVRLAVDMKQIPQKKYALLAELMDRIGRQITGWSKSGAVSAVPELPGQKVPASEQVSSEKGQIYNSLLK